jgi:DNA topoisomerase-3
MVKELPVSWRRPRVGVPAARALGGRGPGRRPPARKAYVDDTKLTDHHAIIPTTEIPGPELAGDHRRLYDLVARRFLAIFLPARVSDETTVELVLKSYTLRATGSVLKEPGWTVALEPGETTRDAEAEQEPDAEPDERQALPALVIGQLVSKRGAELVEKRTSAPKPYTDASLLDAMKRAGRLVTDRDLAEHMKENGLGTPATRAETIEKLVRSEYLERKKKHLLPTPKGVALVDQVDTQLRDPVLTAQWEERLADIEDGKANARDLEADVASWVAELVPSILRSKPMSEETKHEGLGPCPKCQAGFVRKTPKGWGCSRYKEAGCDFVIWAQVAGKKLTEAVARELVQSGTTAHVIDGFVSKEKKTFAARLKLDPNHRVVFVFESARPPRTSDPARPARRAASARPRRGGAAHATRRAARSPSGASTTAGCSRSTSPASSSSTARRPSPSRVWSRRTARRSSPRSSASTSAGASCPSSKPSPRRPTSQRPDSLATPWALS